MASNLLASSEFFKRNLDALKESKPEKARALHRDMIISYHELKEHNSSDQIHKVFKGFEK